MARPLRLEYPGAVYHITSRGNGRADIYTDDVDRELFLRKLAATVERYAWHLYAYCLMGNHYHLLLETPHANLSRGMRQLNGTYTQTFNRRHERVGHVLQGRFQGILVEREPYLLELARYIALNPVRAGFTARIDEWRWSSYRATAGLQAMPRWLAAGALLERFASAPCGGRQAYSRFVAEGISAPAPWAERQGQVILGTPAFVAETAARIGLAREATEIPRAQRLASRPALAALFAQGASAKQRNPAIVDAHVAHGYTLAEIARYLGLHYSTVSRIASRAMRQFKT